MAKSLQLIDFPPGYFGYDLGPLFLGAVGRFFYPWRNNKCFELSRVIRNAQYAVGQVSFYTAVRQREDEEAKAFGFWFYDQERADSCHLAIVFAEDDKGQEMSRCLRRRGPVLSVSVNASCAVMLSAGGNLLANLRIERLDEAKGSTLLRIRFRVISLTV